MCRINSQRLFCTLIVALSAVFSSLQAQTWQRIAPDLFAVQQVSPNVLIAVGSYGLVMRSEDAGNSWRLQSTESNSRLSALYFFDSQKGLAAGDSGAIFTTSDGGESWQRAASPTGATIQGLAFADKGFGIASTADSALLLSVDYGRSWEIVLGNLPQAFGSLYSLQDSVFYALSSGLPGRIYRSADSAKTWEVVYTDSTHAFYDMDFAGVTGLVAGGGVRPNAQADDRAIILRTTDWGKTWERPMLPGTDFELRSIDASPDGSRAIAGGRRATTTSGAPSNRVITSADSGKTWTSHEVSADGSILTVYGIEMLSSSEGIAVGSMQGIYRTFDAGKTWQVRSFCPVHDLADIPLYRSGISGSLYSGQNTIVAFGASRFIDDGVYMQSTDGGTTWSGSHTLDPLTGAVFFDAAKGLGLPREGSRYNASRNLYSIEDSGATWIRKERSFEEDYTYANTSGPVLDGDNLYFTGDSMIFHSTDRGESWKLISTISGVFVLDHLQMFENRWFVNAASANLSTGTIDYRILRSDNHGIRWDTVVTTMSFAEAPSTIAFRNRDHGYYGTRGGKLYRTTNGGTNWDFVDQFGTAAINDLAFFTDSIFYLAANNGLIGYSIDAGGSWAAQHVLPPGETTPNLHSIRLAPDGLSAFITGDGVIMKGTFPEPLTSVREISQIPDEVRTFDVAVYPNPMTGTGAAIHITDLHPGIVQISFYDLTGRLVHSQAVPLQGTEGMFPVDARLMNPGTYRLIAKAGGRIAHCSITILK